MSAPVDQGQIRSILQAHKSKMKRNLSHCMHCSLCAESCFLFTKHDGDPQYMPSYKVLNSLGKLYKKNGRVDRAFLEEIKPIVWKSCVLCGRCYCPVGLDIPAMIALARSICRSQGVYPDDEQSWL
jgi:Fe-S oxidoreductase